MVKLLAVIFATGTGLALVSASALLRHEPLSDAIVFFTHVRSPCLYCLLAAIFFAERNFQIFFTAEKKHISKNPEENIVYAQDVFTFKAKEPVFQIKDFDEASVKKYLEEQERKKKQKDKDDPDTSAHQPFTRPKKTP